MTEKTTEAGKTTTMTPTAAPGAGGRAFDEALTVHNARHPESRLVDVTADLERAGAARLQVLMGRRGLITEDLAAYEAAREKGAGADRPLQRFVILLICAAVHCTGAAMRGRDARWGEFQAAMRGEAPTEGSEQLRRRVGRAGGLLRRMVFAGCVKRGEDGR